MQRIKPVISAPRYGRRLQRARRSARDVCNAAVSHTLIARYLLNVRAEFCCFAATRLHRQNVRARVSGRANSRCNFRGITKGGHSAYGLGYHDIRCTNPAGMLQQSVTIKCVTIPRRSCANRRFLLTESTRDKHGKNFCAVAHVSRDALLFFISLDWGKSTARWCLHGLYVPFHISQTLNDHNDFQI